MRNTYTFIIILSLGFIIKILPIQFLPFDSDQAIVGLMGKHILEGELPWLYYGDSYSGILEPLLVSWSFLFLGINRWSLHLIPFIFSILFIVSIFQLGRELYNREIGLLGMLLTAVPPFSFGFYSSLVYGGYIETLWLGNMILLITHRLAVQKEIPSLLSLFFLGLLWGVAWWTYPISIVYLISSLCFLLFFKIKLIRNGKVLAAAFGFFLGSIPFWIWNVIHRFPFLTFTRFQENPNFFLRINNFSYKFIEVFNASLKEERSFIAYLMAALFLVSLLFLLLGGKWLREKSPSSRGPILLSLFFLSFCFFYIGSRFSEQNALRYLLPLYSILPITLALLCYTLRTVSRYVFWGMTVVILLLNIYQQSSLIQFFKRNAILYRKQIQVERSLFSFLEQEKIPYAYAPEYWSAAELTFNAREHPIFTQPFRDRYPLFTLLADASETRAFVLEGKHRQSFEEMFRAVGGNYKKELFAPFQKVKGYVVYHDFKPPLSTSLEILSDDWKGKSNFNSDSTGWAFDRNISTGWSTSSPQKPGMFYQIDLGRIYKLNRVLLWCEKGKEWDFPAHYRIEISGNERDWEEISSVNNNWGYLFWSGGRPFWKLRDGRMENNFQPREAQFIRVTITGPAPQAWTIGEIFVYQAAEKDKENLAPAEEIISFFTDEKVEYVYADIGLSAQITRVTKGKIKCLQEDYDITQGADYDLWGYNGSFPYFNKLKKRVDFSLFPAFVVAKENNQSFVRTIQKLNGSYQVKAIGDYFIYFRLKIPEGSVSRNRTGSSVTYYWNGTHLLLFNL